MKNYQVSIAIEEEKRLIRAVTASLNELKERENSTTTTIRSYRARYRYWRKNTDLENMQTDCFFVRRAVLDYNIMLKALFDYGKVDENTNLSPILKCLDSLQSALGNLVKYEPYIAYEELLEQRKNIEKAKTLLIRYQWQKEARERLIEENKRIDEYNEKLRQDYNEDRNTRQKILKSKMDEYENDMNKYKKRLKLLQDVQDTVNYFNNNVAKVEMLQVSSDLKVGVIEDNIQILTKDLINKLLSSNYQFDDLFVNNTVFEYADINWDAVWEQYYEGNLRNVQQTLKDGIKRTANRWLRDIETQLLDKVRTLPSVAPIKPHNRVLSKPSYLQKNDVPSIRLLELPLWHPIAEKTKNESSVALEKLVQTLDEYSSGSYENTKDNAEEINRMADVIGENCPKIYFQDTSFKNSKLVRLLNDLENNFAEFGSQRNSAKGRTVIENFKSSVEELKNVRNYSELKVASENFNLTSTAIIAWLLSNWWQNGGKPAGDAHLWKGKYARKLKRPK